MPISYTRQPCPQVYAPPTPHTWISPKLNKICSIWLVTFEREKKINQIRDRNCTVSPFWAFPRRTSYHIVPSETMPCFFGYKLSDHSVYCVVYLNLLVNVPQYIWCRLYCRNKETYWPQMNSVQGQYSRNGSIGHQLHILALMKIFILILTVKLATHVL